MPVSWCGRNRRRNPFGSVPPVSDPQHPEPSEDASPEPSVESAVGSAVGSESMGRHDRLPIKMLQDRLMVQLEHGDGDRRSLGGILIPATAQIGKRLSWAEVKAAGPAVRNVEVGDQVLFNPDDLSEVEVGGELFIILRERDVHAVAAERLEMGSTGLYL